jgi:transposase-like protein
MEQRRRLRPLPKSRIQSDAIHSPEGAPAWWRQFTRGFKLEAVRLIKDRGVSYIQASQDLDVHVS